jgi:APA family basic amino acid/polyamine antiporter
MKEECSMSSQAHEFKRALGPFDATLLVVGSMIGSGIFIVSADIARTVGSPGYLLLVWLLTGMMTLTGALSYGELAGMFPRAGGQYVYLREAWGPLTAFLYGWTLFMVIQTGTIAAVAVAFAKFTAVLLPAAGESHTLVHAGSFRITAAQVVAVISVVLLTFMNTRGIQLGRLVQDTFTVAKTIALIALIVCGVVIGRNALAMEANFSDMFTPVGLSPGGPVPLAGIGLLGAIAVAMVGSLFSSDAWNNVTFTAGEVVDPKRTIPLSLALGTGIVTVLYLVMNTVYLMVLPLAGSADAVDVIGRGIQFAASDRVGTAASTVMFGDAGTFVMAALIMVSTFGCNNGLILAGARVYYTMAKDGLFFARAGSLNERGVPGAALGFQAVWASLLCLSGTYGDLLDYVVFAVLVFYILTVAGIFMLRRSKPEKDRPYRAFGYPVLPALYILAAAGICIALLVLKPAYTWPGVGIVLAGVPVYFIWRRPAAFPS